MQERSGKADTRAERARDHIRGAILRGELEAGKPASEVELAAQLGVSKTPVRQALKLLEQEGLLERGPRRQLIVRALSAEHRREVLEIRVALEEIAIRHACRRMTTDEIDYLHLLLMRQQRAAVASDDEAFMGLDEELHLLIARGAGLQLVHKLLGQLGGFVRIMRIGIRRESDELLLVLEEHRKIVDAVERRDEEAAVKALRLHLHTSEYRLEDAVVAATGQESGSR